MSHDKYEAYLKGPHGLIHTATNGEVVNGRVLNHSLLVNDEQSSQSNALPKEHSDLQSIQEQNTENKEDSRGKNLGKNTMRLKGIPGQGSEHQRTSKLI
jgi:hypothetical protein